MTRRDARSLDHKTLEEMRRMAVKRVLDGETQVAVAASMEVDPRTVNHWMRTYRLHGEEGLGSRKATGRPRDLSAQQVEKLERIIIGKNPRQLNFGPALWTLVLVGQLIERLFGVVHHASTISRLLHALGITPQKPIRRAFQRDEEACQHWMQVEFPAIVRETRRRQATLLFVDETGVREDQPVGRTWGLRGKTPVVAVKGSRRRANVISAISPRGRLWFRCFQQDLNAPLFVSFLAALLEDTSKPIVMILDSHPAHKAALTRRFLHEHCARIKAYYLPAYAPDLNPDEHVWSYLKGLLRSDPLEIEEDLSRVLRASMTKIRHKPALVRSFFDHPAVRYVKEALHW